ncbi:RadC family protein [Pseudoflavitalea rhizosphaerae]|uniref:RadC family protein n=1 Tax=Pseudoflavitalea rhizosphaerae TaxID=1884793 RepID=UPI000F8E7C9E|nr:DNA repair protein RadC [Pseudoflavitalea rhizosphaerae]
MQAKKYAKRKKIYGIQKWAMDERPRERLLSKSPHHLSNAELLALILNSGSSQKTSIDLATEILKLTENNLAALQRITVQQLIAIKGVGPAKAAKVAASLELARRMQAALPDQLAEVGGIKDAAYYLQKRFSYYSHEIFGVMFLNNANRVKAFSVISEGGITGTTVDVRLILKKALETEATKLILGHNHPSGNMQPSKADEELTARIRNAAKQLDIQVLDHLIITQQGYFSFANEGML